MGEDELAEIVPPGFGFDACGRANDGAATLFFIAEEGEPTDLDLE